MGFFDAGEAGVEAAEGVGEAGVVDAEDVEHRGVEVAEVDGVFGDVVAEVVGAAVFDAGVDAGAGEPDGEAAAVVVAAAVRVPKNALAKNSAAEFGEEHHQRVFEEAALFEVVDEGGGGLVDVAALVGELAFDGDVLVPAAVEELDEADAALEQPAGHEAVGGVAAGFVDFGAVAVDDVLRFAAEVRQFGHRGLHAECHFVGGDAGERFGVAGFGGAEMVQFGKIIKQRAALYAVGAGWVVQVEDGARAARRATP